MTEKSEFATLSDLAIEKGVSHSDIISEIHDRVLLEYKKLYPKENQTVEVVVNERTGEVRLMHDRQDVTPDEFSSIADKVAREVIISKLSEAPKTKDVQIIESKEKPAGEVGKLIMPVIFWGYNLIYVFILSIFLFNFLINSEYRTDLLQMFTERGMFGASFLVVAAIIPLVSIFVAYKFTGLKEHDKLGQLFFFFEAPLVFVAFILSGITVTPTPAMWFFLLMLIASIPVFLTYILNIGFDSQKEKIAITLLRQAVAMSVVYFIILFTFITPIVFGYLGKVISEYFFQEVLGIGSSYRYYSIDPFQIIITLIFGGIGVLIVLALTATPYLLGVAVIKIFLSAFYSLKESITENKALKIVSVFAAVWLVLFAVASFQPNPDRYIDKLEKLGAATTFEEKEELAKELMPQEARIKAAFDNLKNARQRYLWSKSDEGLKDSYIDVLNFSDTSAEVVQQAFLMLAYPFVYQGSIDKQYQAAASFEYLFGNEYKKVTPAQTSNVDLLYRKISAVTDYENTLATVTVEEEYKSTSSATRDQEVIYEFSLPPDSVVTDLKLGPQLEFQSIIAPKGAASTVYQAEVNRNRDPALLEQTGPNQYRLSIFPIPGVRSNILLGKNQRVQFTYITALTANGYPLPAYSRQQNLKINSARITALIDNEPTQIENGNIINNSIKNAVNSICNKTDTLNVRSQLGQSSLFFTPNIALDELKDKIKCDNGNLSLAGAAQSLNFAVLLDMSYANKENEKIKQFVNYINENKELLNSNTVFVYKFNNILSKPVKLTSENKDDVLNNTFFGSGDWVRVLSSINENYDFAVFITGEDAPTKNFGNIGSAYPIYIIHDGNIPPYAAEITRPLLQGGGYVFSDFESAFNKAVLTAKTAKNTEGRQLIATGSYFSYFSQTAKNEFILTGWETISTDSDPAAKLAAKKISDAKIASQPGNFESQLSYLDSLNSYATSNSIVTPYSSMIALVNEQQMQNLKRQAQSYDRYQEQSRNISTVIIPAPLRSGVANPFGGSTQLFSLEMAPSDGGGSVNLSPGGGGGGLAAAPSFSALSSGPRLSMLGFLPLFILANGLLIGIGVIFYAVKKVRAKKSISN